MPTTADAIQLITDNLITVLKGLKLNISYGSDIDFGNVANTELPTVRVLYLRDAPEYTRAQRQSYRESFFELQLILEENNLQELMRQMQVHVHNIINNIIVDNLNIDDLSDSKIITLAEIVNTEDPEYKDNRVRVVMELSIRYRDEST